MNVLLWDLKADPSDEAAVNLIPPASPILLLSVCLCLVQVPQDVDTNKGQCVQSASFKELFHSQRMPVHEQSGGFTARTKHVPTKRFLVLVLELSFPPFALLDLLSSPFSSPCPPVALWGLIT